MTGHWSKPIDFSDETMEQAASQLATFENALLVAPTSRADWGELEQALEDDFNTPEALAVFHRWRSVGATDELRRGLALFGIAPTTPDAPDEIRVLADERRQARLALDFAQADRLREAIESQGWEVRDVGDGYQLVPR